MVHSNNFLKDLDEGPEAYKDIQVVMENPPDLVDILVESLNYPYPSSNPLNGIS